MENWKEKALDGLLDFLIGMCGVSGAIAWLLDEDLTEEQVIELGFTHEDIVEAIEE